MKHQELTHKIIGLSMKIHSALGAGFQEVIYQRCLEIEFNREKLQFVREFEMPVMYENIQVGTRRVDFFVAEKIMVELKAVSELNDAHLAQAKNYLEAYKLDTGLLINFGSQSLEYKRMFGKR
ncbi:MAG: GxxExxY protein [Balneolaceae bacterium]|nr:GxxExxY protein [Balneolaceae bacterium]